MKLSSYNIANILYIFLTGIALIFLNWNPVILIFVLGGEIFFNFTATFILFYVLGGNTFLQKKINIKYLKKDALHLPFMRSFFSSFIITNGFFVFAIWFPYLAIYSRFPVEQINIKLTIITIIFFIFNSTLKLILDFFNIKNNKESIVSITAYPFRLSFELLVIVWIMSLAIYFINLTSGAIVYLFLRLFFEWIKTSNNKYLLNRTIIEMFSFGQIRWEETSEELKLLK